MQTASRVLELLYDRPEGFWSLADLAQQAELSAEELHAELDALIARGVALEREPARGVRLVRPGPLDAHLIERDLSTQRIGRNTIVFDAVDSTNDVAADSARQDGADGLVILAEHQRQGRGRLGRTWLSPPRENVLMSVLLLDDGGPIPVEPLTIAAGLAVAEGIDAACGNPTCQLRWPNDVLVAGGKVAGILVERRGSGVIVGIGINANARPSDDQVDRPATSLAEQAGGPVERIELVRAVLGRLDHWVAELSAGDLAALHRDWVARCGMINQRVTIRAAGRTHVGRVLDVSPLEGLVLAGDDGRRVHIPAVEATLAD